MTAVPARFLPDSSCMIAAVCAWHEHHTRAAAAIEERLAAGEQLVVAGPALIEAYAVLTRLPAPHRLAPETARDLLAANFMERPPVALDGRAYQRLVRGAPDEDIAGGRTYDAVIAACAIKAKVARLLTLNERHFAAFADRLQIIVPAEG